MSDTYNIGLGNNDTDTRIKADSDFVSLFGMIRQKISLGFLHGKRLWIGSLHLQNGLLGARLMPHTML